MRFVALWLDYHKMITWNGTFYCKFYYIIPVFDIKSDQFFTFIHILDHSLFDCRVKNFWDQIWNFFQKKSLQNWWRNAFFSDIKGDQIFASWTQCIKPLFLNDPLIFLKTTFFSRNRIFFFENLVRKVIDQFSIRIRTGTGTGTAGNGMESSNRNRTDGQIMELQV